VIATPITGPLLVELSQLIADDTGGEGRIEIDPDDGTGQTLLVWYPRVDGSDTGYVQAAAKLNQVRNQLSTPTARS
jgi:hypothetical protein